MATTYISENNGDGRETFIKFASKKEAKEYIKRSIKNWVNNGIEGMDDDEVKDYAQGLFEIIDSPSSWVIENSEEY